MSSGGGSLLCGAGRGSGRGICGSAYSGRGDELRLEKREPAGGDLSPAGFGLEQPLQSSCEGVQIDGGGEPQGAGVSAIRPDGQGPVGPAAAKGDGDSVNGNFPGGGVVGIISGRVFVPRSHPESHVLGVAGAADLCGVPAQSGVCGLGDREGNIFRLRDGKAHQFTQFLRRGSGLDLESPTGDGARLAAWMSGGKAPGKYRQ